MGVLGAIGAIGEGAAGLGAVGGGTLGVLGEASVGVPWAVDGNSVWFCGVLGALGRLWGHKGALGARGVV